jgi:hypothetical protein
MAFSIFVSVIAFVFWSDFRFAVPENSNTESAVGGFYRYIKVFLVSFICLMAMWMSYQASSGIFLVMILGLTLKDFLDNVRIKNILKKNLIFISSYFFAALIFKFAMPAPKGYRKTEIFAFSEMISGLYYNIAELFKTLLSYLNEVWNILAVLLFICFIASLIIFSKRKRAFILSDVVAGVLFVALAVPASYGAFLVLKENPLNGRSLIGIGMVLAIIGIITTKNFNQLWQKFMAVPLLILLYSFLVFSFAFGNVLADQERYANFRNELLLDDLSRIWTSKDAVAKTKLQIEGNIGRTDVAIHVASRYPVIKSIWGQVGLQDDWFGFSKLRYYYNRKQERISNRDRKMDANKMKTVLDTYYHTIKEGENGDVLVILK